MFDNGPNYSSYTLDELFEAYSSIDRNNYPERFKEIKEAIAKKQNGEYQCLKCGCGGYEASQMYTAQDRFESVFDYESGKFITISCLDCGYTEIYKRQSSTTGSLLDFFVS